MSATAPAVVPIQAHVGEYWAATLTVDLPSWVGWSAQAQIRHYAGASLLLVELTCDLTVAGQVTVSLPPGATAGLGSFQGQWDLLVSTAGTDPQYIAEGPVSITDRVTIPA